MPLPRTDPLSREPREVAEQFPARNIRPEKIVEGSLLTLADITPGGIGAAAAQHGHLLDKLDAIEAPGVSDDFTAGFSVGSRWVDVANDREYVCLDVTEDAAIWRRTTHLPTAVDDVASPPTDAELDTAFGQPGTLGDGFVGVLDDAGAGTTVWLCVAMNSAWWYEELTKAT